MKKKQNSQRENLRRQSPQLDDSEKELIALEVLLKRRQLELEILKLEKQIKHGKAQLEQEE